MTTTTLDYTNPLTQSYLQSLVERLQAHQKAMSHFYDDFSDEELRDLMNSNEHKSLSDALQVFYKKHNV